MYTVRSDNAAVMSSTFTKKQSYDAVFKLKAVYCAENSTNGAAAKKFGVDGYSVNNIHAALE